MSKKVAIVISPNWRDYAEKYLADCLESLRKQNWAGESKIFLIDNETGEESFGLLKKIVETQNPPAPLLSAQAGYQGGDVEIIRNKNNDGFAKGNNGAIELALEQGFDYVVLFNMDAIVEKNCVSELVKTAESDERIGAVQARLMLWPEKEKINSLGNATHFLGFGYCIGYGGKIENLKLKIENSICYPSGAAVLFKAEILKKVGLFDEEFWMYNEDQDLGWRIWLAGYKCVLAPEAVVYHKYEFAKSIRQYYWMDRNRILAILKNYRLPTLVLIFPAFLVMEFGLLLFSIKTGWFKEKLKIYKYFLTPKNWAYILKVRRKTQSLRKVKDRDIVKMFTGKIWYQEIGDWKLKLVNPVFQAYWWAMRKIIFW
ncbi:MAG: glycosyltransferase family 2 protein [Patescibacteria group bacterium]|nr:glycosyltransferase family 2 protein [Patescibacteria group bacterium]